MASHRRTFAAALAVTAASVSLYPIFMGTLWFWAGLGSATVAALAGTATRLRRLPASACLAGGAVAQLLYLNLAFANARSLWHVLPTPASVRLLWDMASHGLTEAATYAPPVPELPGMVVLAAGGIGITALLTDLIAVRLGSVALAGLPLLLVFTEPAMLGISRSFAGTAVAFAAGTGGYLMLLRGEGRDRIREWGDQGQSALGTAGTQARAVTGRRVAFTSVLLALLVPLVIPGLHVTPLFGEQPGTGGSDAVAGFPDPNTLLSSELRMRTASNVLTYTTTAPVPDYLQVYVLDKLTDDGWRLFSQPESLVPADPRLPAPAGLTARGWVTTATTRVSISPGVSQDALSALPVPYPATSVSAPGTPSADRSTLMVLDPGTALGGLRYTVTSLSASPPGQFLNSAPRPPASITGHYLQVPASYGRLRAIAESVVRAAGASTPFQKAIAIQDWLASGSFTYTLDAPTVVSADGLANFLKVTKRGYCQQFSFAMAVLARLAGIPSRVAYGFTSGTPAGDNEWLVTTHDAHAWPELYFQGFGWLRFEPTPSGPGGRGTATTPSYALAPGGATPGGDSPMAPSVTPSTAPSATAGPGSPGQSGSRRKPGLQFGGQGSVASASGPRAHAAGLWEALGLVLAGLLALALVTPRCARLLIRRHRWNAGRRGARAPAGPAIRNAALANAAWRELRDDLADHAADCLPSESPRAVAERTAASLALTAQARAALNRIVLAEERARYAASPADGSRLRADSATVRRAIATAMPRRTRWRATLMPTSVLSLARSATSSAADAFGRLNPHWPGRLRAWIFRASARASRLP